MAMNSPPFFACCQPSHMLTRFSQPIVILPTSLYPHVTERKLQKNSLNISAMLGAYILFRLESTTQTICMLALFGLMPP